MNTVRLGADDIIYQEYVGDQNRETVALVVEQAMMSIDTLRQKQKPVYMLVDISRIGRLDTGARSAAFEGIGKLDIDKLALCGATLFLQHVATLILSLSPKKDKVKMFDTNDEAKLWLETGV